MAKGRALLVGLKSLDPGAHNGWDGRNGCWGCELDVDNIERILEPMGYSVSTLKTAQATSDNVLGGLRAAAEELQGGDIFVFYYSGHGSQQPDVSGDEFDGRDETLVLYDRQVIDDELNAIWPSFRDGVRIVMISDSCNSGNNYRRVRDVASSMARPISLTECLRGTDMKAQMLHYSGCREDQTAQGYQMGGAFTMAFCRALDLGVATNYRVLHDQTRIWLRAGPYTPQEPQYTHYGPVSSAFENSRPFSIESMATMESQVRDAVRVIPVSWLHKPALADEKPTELDGARIGPFAAAVIGVAVGAGIQLGAQALNRSDSHRQVRERDVSQVRCHLSIAEIENLALANVTLLQKPGVDIIRDVQREGEGERLLPVPVIAFLTGVATGAAAARS